MIPLARRSTSRKLETALLSCSRQSLPRPARLYSTPSKSAHFPALATATAPPQEDYAIHLRDAQALASGIKGGDPRDGSLSTGVNDFLNRSMPYTVLPAPLPGDSTSQINEMIFPGSQMQESLTIIDTCLRGCYDVARAEHIFHLMRSSREGAAVLQPRVFNLFLETYLELATGEEYDPYDDWLERAWRLYDGMENGWEVAAPTSGTYAIMLKAWLKKTTLNLPPEVPSERSPADLLRCMLNRNINLLKVIADRTLSSADSSEITQHLCRAAAEMGLHNVITDLGQAQIISDDPLAGVPEVMPVKIARLPTAKDIPEETLKSMAEAGETVEITEETPFNIANLRKHLAEVAYAQRLLPDDTASRQKLLESSVYDLAVERLRYECAKLEEVVGNQHKLLTAQLQGWMYDWHERLQKRLVAEIEEVVREESLIGTHKKDSSRTMRLGPFLSLLKPSKLSLIAILELMRLQGSGGVSEGMKTARALLTVGKAVELEYKAEILRKNNVHVPAVPKRPNDVGFFTNKAYEELRAWRTSASQYLEDNVEWTADWTHSVRARVGSFLVDCLMDVATVQRTAVDRRTGEEVFESQPAFYHCYEYLRGQRLGVIRLNPVVAERLQKDDIRATLHPRHLPMLIKPKAWINHDEGGYVYNKNSVMRLKDTQEQLTYLRHASEAGHMEHVFAGLDVLGSTPWIVNREIFDVVLEVWNAGERFLKIPEASYSKPEPVKPDNYDTDAESKTRYLQAWKQWQSNKANCHSNRCSVNYKVEIARAFLADTMYFPHNIDFRGRAYPIPPHMNHIGDDLSRGLMKFGESKPLGASGLRWLKIHLANLYGFDKANFEERIQFVHDHMDEIKDSAENPLGGKRWWTKADDPWQCLAACKELRHALDLDDPEAYESNLPVHQDGTCNGLQHYAALGGDTTGARQVNLDITDRPADVYTHVADMVEKIIDQDIQNDHKYAKMLKGKISRKVVKQTVMTTVYGVTFVGAREQIERQLKDRGDIPAHETWGASSYLAKVVMSSIGDLFSGAKSIMTWLTSCARLISKSMPKERIETAIEEHMQKQMKNAKKAGKPLARNDLTRAIPFNRLPKEQMTSVVWTTPLGLPIVQPYRKTRRKQVMTSIQTVFISDPNAPSEVNTSKQATAFPPNFIHSLDATHMMLTALECSKAGLSFASVHDSYWTHAGTVNRMNEIIRDTFIALHESNVMDRLRQEFLDRYKDYQIPLVSLRTPTMKRAIGSKYDNLAELSGNKSDLQLGEDQEDQEAVMEALEASESADGFEGESEESIAELIGALPSEPDVIGDVKSSPSVISGEVTKPKRRRRTRKEIEAAKKEMEEAKEAKRNEEANDSIETVATKRQQEPMVSRFVNFVDIIPPVPKKGEFDVKKIKQSKYFFS